MVVNLAGPVAVLKRIADIWKVSDAELAIILACDSTHEARDIIEGRRGLLPPNQASRVRYLFSVHETLSELLRDEKAEARWLRRRSRDLGGLTPLEVLLRGRIEGILRVKHFANRCVGR